MAEAGTTLDSADILKLMRILPHRYPFLLVDRIIEIDGDNSAIGIKNVTTNEPHFQGHFPEQPVMPGFLSLRRWRRRRARSVSAPPARISRLWLIS